MKNERRFLLFNMKRNKGITLIALVITIIILLILAGISIAMLTGDNGILTQAAKAKEETEKAKANELSILGNYEYYISKYTNDDYIESKGVNAPILKDSMELVSYDETSKEWVTNNSISSFDYIAGTGTEDNNSSKWANARVTIDGVDSYFVWIPRYAYKITYNNPDDISEGGTIDVKFLIGTTDQYYDDNGDLQIAKRATTGHEDTTSDYYVHPAFTNNVDLGGWRNELTGIWVGKYESSLVNKLDSSNIVTNDNTTGNILLSENVNKAIAVQAGMSSWRYCTIGNFYANAINYAKNFNSHMLKNSEWGAVAYLTHSQYGRNGHEVEINDNSSFITADEGIAVNLEESSTGNVYGIYDLTGGTSEFVAAYYNKSTSNSLIDNGEVFAKKDGISTEYATAYLGDNVNENYIIGDATLETSNWNESYASFLNTNNPFFNRGGSYNSSADGYIFLFSRNDGSGYYPNVGSRISLAI